MGDDESLVGYGESLVSAGWSTISRKTRGNSGKNVSLPSLRMRYDLGLTLLALEHLRVKGGAPRMIARRDNADGKHGYTRGVNAWSGSVGFLGDSCRKLQTLAPCLVTEPRFEDEEEETIWAPGWVGLPPDADLNALLVADGTHPTGNAMTSLAERQRRKCLLSREDGSEAGAGRGTRAPVVCDTTVEDRVAVPLITPRLDGASAANAPRLAYECPLDPGARP